MNFKFGVLCTTPRTEKSNPWLQKTIYCEFSSNPKISKSKILPSISLTAEKNSELYTCNFLAQTRQILRSNQFRQLSSGKENTFQIPLRYMDSLKTKKNILQELTNVRKTFRTAHIQIYFL